MSNIIQNLRGEIWKEYPLWEERANTKFRLFVSNFGRVKSVNTHCPEGRLLKGSRREGYPIISMRLFNERSKYVQGKIDEYNQIIDLLQQEIKDLRRIKNMPQDIVAARLVTVRANRDEMVQTRKKFIHKTDKKRTVHVHVLVHRAVAELFLEKTEKDEVVIHKDFVKDHNHVDNLEWVSREESFNRYSQNPYYLSGKYKEQFQNLDRRTPRNQKLKKEEVLYIKEKLAQGKTLKELAKKFGVSDMQIHRIKTGENWSSVKTVKELYEENHKNKKWQAT